MVVGTILIGSIIATVLTLIYLYVKHAYSYWQRRGVESLTPTFPFGNFTDAFLQRISIGKIAERFYNESNAPFVGVYVATRPILVLRDPEVIRHVLIRDFQHFHDRGVYVDEKRDPLSAHLFGMSGQKWKNLRTKLTPTFTSGKLKAMFSTLVDCGNSLQTYINKVEEQKTPFDIRELAASYSTNVIASVAFGINIDCISNPNEDFRKFGRKAFTNSALKGLLNFLRFVFPSMLKYIPIHVMDKEIEHFMTGVVKETLEYREKNGVIRKDFFQLLVQLRNTGTVQLDDQWETQITADNTKTLTLEEVTAQSFIFWAAGFETSSTTMSFCLYEIAKNADIQRKVHAEIDRVLAEHKGEISYQSVSEMKYLESCIDETLRLYPPLPQLNRECTKEYTIPDTDITIEKGTTVLIPALALQRDERYYPNPKQFIPDRFSDENSHQSFVERPYLPFGEGPRVCIGLRMGKMQTKVALIVALKTHRYELTPKDVGKEIEINARAFLLAPKDKIELLVFKR